MRSAQDLLLLRKSKPPDTLLFVASQRQGAEIKQREFFVNFNDECVTLASGIPQTTHGMAAAELAAETAVWAYKLVRQRNFYWTDKKKFMKRIFRSTNLTIWQKKRESGFSEGLFVSLLVFMTSGTTLWIGNIGACAAFLYHHNALQPLIKRDMDSRGKVTRMLGQARLGLIPHYVTARFPEDATVLLVSGGLAEIPDHEMLPFLSACGDTSDSHLVAQEGIFSVAERLGMTDNMTAIFIKHIARHD